MALTRTDHWATREFHAFLALHENDRFAWGVVDCCLFPADAIQSFTGVDLACEFRGLYASQTEALAVIRKVTGGSTVADAAAYAAERHSLTEWKSPLLAKRGDLVVISDGEQLVGGVMHLNGRHAITVGPDGLKRFPISSVVRAWQI